ncbi:COP23 domain-containing protein [Nostoc piscinale]|uniref:COP23 domain-containing protein n=1 Tax=Nostoc piscinale TaxID=224012 RepID=UPI0039A71329
MAFQPLKLLCLGGLGLSLFLGNSAAFAQVNDGGGIVVPTTSDPYPSGSSNPVDTSSSGTVATGTRFSCQNSNGQYIVMYQPESQPGRFFPWAAPAQLGGGWDPYKRCVTIAQRLEEYRPDGLQELQTGFLNNENIVCVTTEANSSCRIVLTVPRDKDPYTVRNSIFQNLISADDGQQTTAVNTFRNNRGGADEIYNIGRTILGGNNRRVSSSRSGINLKPFLDRKDGGTGTQLRNGVAIRRQTPTQSQNRTRLNPGNFR